jgi:acetylornithine/N-succinyldiaminopimelate aminotransferase
MDAQYLAGVRAACDEFGLLMIVDEIQCGMGRTGSLFAHEAAGIAPDIMTIAKAIGGGFPLGAVLATERAAAAMVAGSHGSTYGGNPLACAVGLAVMDEVATPAFLEQVRARAGFLWQRLGALAAENPDVIEEVRGLGLMVGLRLRPEHTPAAFVQAARDAGLLVVPAADNVVRLLPALNIPEADLAEGVSRLDAACKAVNGAA